jgi:TetR/AcrR family transcriptional repressor of nem operon
MARPSVRNRLLDAATETFHRYGFNGCGVQDITAAAGVPKGSFYNHFPSKEALGAEALEHYWDKARSSAFRILDDPALSPLERLRRYFDTIAEKLIARDFASGCLLGNLSAEIGDQSPLISSRLSSIFAGWTEAVQICVREAQAAGEVRSDLDPAVLAAFLVNAWEGAILRAKVDKTSDPFAQFDSVVFSSIVISPAVEGSQPSSS